jgi:hypothetical protein
MQGYLSAAIKFSLAAIMMLTLGFVQTAASQGSSETSKKAALELYSEGTFAAEAKLVKPRLAPTITYVCSSLPCRKTIDELYRTVPREIEQATEPVLRSSRLIDVFFHANDAARASHNVQYALSPKWKISRLKDSKCEVARFTEGYEVKKVIISVVEDAGPRGNLGCILTEMLRGTGFNINQKYAGYSRELHNFSDKEFQTYLAGISNFMRVHWSNLTKPGMTKNEALNQLDAMAFPKLVN